MEHLTIESISAAITGNEFWLNPESKQAMIVNQAEEEGYLKRLSHTQVEWKGDAIEKLRLIEKHYHSLCEAVADIAYIAGENKYSSRECRKDILDFIEWGKEFKELNKGVEWDVNTDKNYGEAIYDFTIKKLEKDKLSNKREIINDIPLITFQSTFKGEINGEFAKIYIGKDNLKNLYFSYEFNPFEPNKTVWQTMPPSMYEMIKKSLSNVNEANKKNIVDDIFSEDSTNNKSNGLKI